VSIVCASHHLVRWKLLPVRAKARFGEGRKEQTYKNRGCQVGKVIHRKVGSDLSRRGFVFQKSGMTLGGTRVESHLCESGARDLKREGTVKHKRPATGLIKGAAHSSFRAAMRTLWIIACRGELEASAAIIGEGVNMKQFKTQR